MKDRNRPAKFDRDVDECREKIYELLTEFNCNIEIDDNGVDIIVIDTNTLAFSNL